MKTLLRRVVFVLFCAVLIMLIINGAPGIG